MTHVARVGPAWLFVMFTLCHLLCSRVTEILKLQLQDVDLDNDKITVKPLKNMEASQSQFHRRYGGFWTNGKLMVGTLSL